MNWYTADLHLGHGNIIQYAKRDSLGSIQDHDNAIIDNLNNCVAKKDRLFILGDFCFSKGDYLANVARLRNRIRCEYITFVLGNHDRRSIKQHFPQCFDYFEQKVDGQLIVMSHYPMAAWNKSHRGSWMLYGHCHTTAEDWLDGAMPTRKSIDVGVDNAKRLLGSYKPFSFDELKDIFHERSGCSIDSGKRAD